MQLSGLLWFILVTADSCQGQKRKKKLFKSLFVSMPWAARETIIYFTLKPKSNVCETGPCFSDLALWFKSLQNPCFHDNAFKSAPKNLLEFSAGPQFSWVFLAGKVPGIHICTAVLSKVMKRKWTDANVWAEAPCHCVPWSKHFKYVNFFCTWKDLLNIANNK